MREIFQKQLSDLKENLKKMGSLCVDCIDGATKAILLNDPALGDTAIEAEKEIDILEKDIQALCLKIILQQQPVAADLKLVSASLKSITDMERIGDQGSDIAYLIKRADGAFIADNKHIANMASAVISIVTNSVESFINENFELAVKSEVMDDQVDELFYAIRNDIIEMMTSGVKHEKNVGEKAINTFMIAKYLERIGDHAVNIAECAKMICQK